MKKIIIVCLLYLSCVVNLAAQPACEPPLEGSISVSGPVCAGGFVTISFLIDDDDDDLSVTYSINGVVSVAEDVDDDFEITYQAFFTTNVVLIQLGDGNCVTNINQSVPIVVVSPQLDIDITDPACGQSNGSVLAVASSGVPPYQYRINGGPYQSSGLFTGLPSGSYSIEVLDGANCPGEESVVLQNADGPELVIASTSDPACGQSNGSISAQATGGTPPYQYRLNGGAYQSGATFSGLAAGSYLLEVRDANNCEAGVTTNLSAVGGPQLSIGSFSNPSCGASNGSISAQATGGTPPYQYRLNGGAYQSGATFSGLAAGSYLVEVRDANNCVTFSTPVELSTITLPPASVSANTTTGCVNTTFVLTGNQPAGATGVWSSPQVIPPTPNQPVWSLSGLAPGTTTVIWTLSAPGCPNYDTASVTLTIPPSPLANWDGIFTLEAEPTIQTFPILSNDQWPSSGGISVSIVQAPQYGLAEVNAQNRLEYTPFANIAVGNDALVYRICSQICPDICDTALVLFRFNVNENPCVLTGDTSFVFTNGLTPNNDGRNDVLVFRAVSVEECEINYAQSEIIIYNRWGDIVYSASPYANNWGGTNGNGQDLPPGVYYFVLRITLEKTYTQFGSVLILR